MRRNKYAYEVDYSQCPIYVWGILCLLFPCLFRKDPASVWSQVCCALLFPLGYSSAKVSCYCSAPLDKVIYFVLLSLHVIDILLGLLTPL